MRINHTASHGSHEGSEVICKECGIPFLPRIKAGPNKDRFCCSRCKDQWHNRRRKSPPAQWGLAAGKGIDQAISSGQESTTPRLLQQDTKIRRVLSAFAQGRSLNRFEAARELHDCCLPSTVAAIQHRGIVVSRRIEIAEDYIGAPSRVCRYWLQQEEREKAAVLLG